MGKPVPKRLLAWLLAAMVALIVAPGAAFADDYAAGTLGAQDDAASWEEIADDTVVFSLNVNKGDGVSTTAKAFTKAEFETLSQENTTPATYTFSSGRSGPQVAYSNKYVTLDQMLSAAGVEFEQGDTIIPGDANGDTTKGGPTPFEGFSDRKFFPAYSSTSTAADGATVTPAIVAIKYATEVIAETAGKTVTDTDWATKVSYSGLRNFWGKTQSELTNGEMGGSNYWSNATYLRIDKPFKIYTRTGAGEKTLVKSYTAAQLKSMATTAESAETAPGFLFNKSGWQVGTTTSYIPLKTLLSDAGVTLKDGLVLQATASDGFTTSLSYDQLKNAKYFYPATTSRDIVATGAEEPGAVLALNWATTPFGPEDNPIKLDSTAGEAKLNMFNFAATFEQQTRIFVGLTSPTDTNTGGNRFATGPVEFSITTTKDISDSTVTVSGVDASYTYTGEAIEPKVVVKDGDTTLSEVSKKGVGDYSVSYESNTAVGTGKVIITGKNAYTGTKTIEFKIVGIDISKATVTAAGGTYTGKALTPAPTVKLGDTTLKSGTDYTVSYKDNTNAGTATVTVTGKGNYSGTATGSFKIVAASIAKANITVKAATYTGNALKPAPTVKLGSTTLKKGTDYTITYMNNTNAGEATLTITGKGNYVGKASKSFTIAKAANVLKVDPVKKTQTAKAGKVTTIAASKAFKVKTNKSKGAVSYKKTSGNAKITVNSNGKVTVKKGLKAGKTYTVTVKATTKATANYKAASAVVTFKVKVTK